MGRPPANRSGARHPNFRPGWFSSTAYGPEAALTLLIPLLGVRYFIPISVAIIALLIIVYFSYRQTIPAYPAGGGSYTVARFKSQCIRRGLLAASALLADYILTAAVGISSGVAALVSAVPALLPHTVALYVGILAIGRRRCAGVDRGYRRAECFSNWRGPALKPLKERRPGKRTDFRRKCADGPRQS